MSIYDYLDELKNVDGLQKDVFEKCLIELVEKYLEKYSKKDTYEEINHLKYELSKYKNIKENYDAFIKEKEQLEKRKIELEEEYQNKLNTVERDFYRKKISEIIPREMLAPLFILRTKTVEKEKCPLCDDDRKYTFFTPDGLTHRVNCKCKGEIDKYFVIESNKRKLLLDKKGNEVYNTSYFYNDDYDTFISLSEAIILDKFDENNLPDNPKYTLFTSKEEAQKYADYLNKL